MAIWYTSAVRDDGDEPRPGADHHINSMTRSRVVRAIFSLSPGLEPLMDCERKTLAEFSRTYLRSFEMPVILETILDGDNAEGRFAASVPLGMRRSVMDRERPDH
jgi:hypothetical protein